LGDIGRPKTHQTAGDPNMLSCVTKIQVPALKDARSESEAWDVVRRDIAAVPVLY